MTEIIEVLFLAAVGLIFFSYFGYPLSIYFISLIWKRKLKKATIFPNVNLIITAYNEENKIKQKLENTLNLEYPKKTDSPY